MDYKYTLSFSDFRAAHWLFLKHRPLCMALLILTCVLPLFLLSFSLLPFLFAVGTPRESFAILKNLSPLIVLVILFFCLRQWNLWNTYRTMFPKGTAREAIFSFNREQIISSIPGRNEARFHWSTLVDYAEDKRLLLLFPSKNRFLIVVKTDMPESYLAAIRAEAQQYLKMN